MAAMQVLTSALFGLEINSNIYSEGIVPFNTHYCFDSQAHLPLKLRYILRIFSRSNRREKLSIELHTM